MAAANELIASNQLRDAGNNERIVEVLFVDGLRRDDGTPAQLGDVLSVQPDGALQTRPPGTAGPFERCVVGNGVIVFRPLGNDGRCFWLPLATFWPNAG